MKHERKAKSMDEILCKASHNSNNSIDHRVRFGRAPQSSGSDKPQKRTILRWPGHASELRIGVEDTGNSFKCANKGRSVSTADWKAARAQLWAEHDEWTYDDDEGCEDREGKLPLLDSSARDALSAFDVALKGGAEPGKPFASHVLAADDGHLLGEHGRRLMFPCKRPVHGTEPGPEEGVMELSLKRLRCGRRHALAACRRTLALPCALLLPLATRSLSSETECWLALRVFAGPSSRCGRRTRQRDWGLLPRRSSTCAGSWVSGGGPAEAGRAKSLTAPGALRRWQPCWQRGTLGVPGSFARRPKWCSTGLQAQTR
jgi:hypothetical protein